MATPFWIGQREERRLGHRQVQDLTADSQERPSHLGDVVLGIGLTRQEWCEALGPFGEAALDFVHIPIDERREVGDVAGRILGAHFGLVPAARGKQHQGKGCGGSCEKRRRHGRMVRRTGRLRPWVTERLAWLGRSKPGGEGARYGFVRSFEDTDIAMQGAGDLEGRDAALG